MNLKYIFHLQFIFFISLAILSSCVNPKKATYFNNIQDTIIRNKPFNAEIVIENNDLLNIIVSSLNPEATVIFNAPNLSSALSTSTSGSTGVGLTGTPQFT